LLDDAIDFLSKSWSLQSSEECDVNKTRTLLSDWYWIGLTTSKGDVILVLLVLKCLELLSFLSISISLLLSLLIKLSSFWILFLNLCFLFEG